MLTVLGCLASGSFTSFRMTESHTNNGSMGNKLPHPTILNRFAWLIPADPSATLGVTGSGAGGFRLGTPDRCVADAARDDSGLRMRVEGAALVM